jgi:hypothetical protein
MRSRKVFLVLVGVGLLAAASVASATTVMTGEISSGSAGTFTAPASLISGAPAFTGGAAPLYTAPADGPWAGWAQMTDGYVGPANENLTCMLLDNITDSPWAVWNLDTVAKPAGYDIGSIQSFAGFNQNRPWQGVEIKYALVGDTVTPGTELGRTLGQFHYQPALSATWNATKMTIADDVSATMLSGVSAIEVKFIDNGFTQSTSFNMTSYREVSIASPVPEPSSLILASGVLGLLAYAWKKRR